MLVASYGALLKLSRRSELKIRTIPLWPARAPKFRQLAEIQDQLDCIVDVLGVKLLTVVTPSLLKKVVTLGVKMRDSEDLTGGIHTFVLGQHTSARRKRVSTAAD